jgi:hypothetical protein
MPLTRSHVPPVPVMTSPGVSCDAAHRCYSVGMDEIKPQPYDRYTLSLYCQHCGNYLTTLVGVERERLPKVRTELRQEAQAHAEKIGREVEITLYLTLERRVWFMPKPQRPT